jgi:hypothetical protein
MLLNPFIDSIHINNLRSLSHVYTGEYKTDVINITTRILENIFYSNDNQYGKISVQLNSSDLVGDLENIGYTVSKEDKDKNIYSITFDNSPRELFDCKSVKPANDLYTELVKKTVMKIVDEIKESKYLTVSSSIQSSKLRQDVIDVLKDSGYYIKMSNISTDVFDISLVPFTK